MRDGYGNFLLIPPGSADMTHKWSTLGLITRDGDDSVCRLTIQKQPGQGPEPVAFRLTLPNGATVVQATEGMEVSDDRLTYSTTMIADLTFEVRYRIP